MGKTFIRRRRLFEVEFLSAGGTQRKRTPLPVFVIEPHVGVAEAWAMIHAAENLWEKDLPDWVEMDT